jgi:phospholipid/cholesterol/gamma-HCH transport system substrate-binding protein
MSKLLDHHRLLGAIFIGMLVLGIWLVNAVFTQKFISFDNVGLKTDTIGLQLPKQADVKVRGVIIGQVNKIASNGEGATLTLGIKPDKIKMIPKNVTAAILPKTLFGEKYVELEIPKNPSSTSLRSGDTIDQTKLPIEVEKVLNDIYPLLRTVQPAELNYTLNALATALEGRGNKIGQSLVTLDTYLKQMNPELPALISDIKLLSKVTSLYADVTPDLAATLRNTVKTGNTLHSKEATLQKFLDDTSSFSDTATSFLNENGDNIIKLGKLGEPILSLLARYSPEFPCLLGGIVKQAPQLGQTFRGFIFHINLRIVPQPRGYTSADKQVYGADNGPNCAGNPNPPIPYGAHNNFPNLKDGVDDGPGQSGKLGKGPGDNQRTATEFGVRQTQTTQSGQSTQSAQINVTPGGTSEQKKLVNSLTAPVLGIPVTDMSDVATLLFLPAISGTEVSVQ